MPIETPPRIRTVNNSTKSKSLSITNATTTYHRTEVAGIVVFYREAGPIEGKTIVLMHGFPSSSRQYETLIPILATRFRVIAPDYPGFGHSDSPPPSAFQYTFDNLATVMADFLDKIGVVKCSFFLHDYGGPIGFRVMIANPDRVECLIIQNANAYEQGLGRKWEFVAKYWKDPNSYPEVVDAFLSLSAAKDRHLLGTKHPERYNPGAWQDEFVHLSKPGQRDIQERLLYDYQTNVESYPHWQNWLRKFAPPTLVVWGANDPSFISAGAKAYGRDVPDAEIHLLCAGHFGLDEKNDEIAGYCLDFLNRKLKKA